MRPNVLGIAAMLFGLAMLSCPFGVQAAQSQESPVADTRAVVKLGHARFTVLTAQLVRMEWASDDKFEDHASFVFLNRKLPVPAFEKQITRSDAGQTLTIKTRSLELKYTDAPGSNGKFSADNLTITLTVNGQMRTWHPGMPDTGNLLGTTRTLDGIRGDKLKKPLSPGLISRDGWTLVDDSTGPLFDSADFAFSQGEESPWPWVLSRPPGDRQDWYFFGYGHDYKKALGDYVRVAGRIPLPPRFVFGAWWSRYWAYSDQELVDLVRDFRSNDVPLDVLVIDMDWHTSSAQLQGQVDQSGEDLGWSGYTWNSALFPNPAQFLRTVHAQGLKVTLNLHPASGVQPWETHYPEMARAMGIDPATKKYVPFNITDKRFATNYMNLLHHPLEKQGVDFWWLDWQQAMSTPVPGVNPVWWLNYVHFTDQERERKRPLLFHRWGGLGNHRYEIGFSGDTYSTWESLAFQPQFTATAANVGYAYWSHDIGGHMPGSVDPELYTRWIQFGAFSPVLRTHTTKNPDAERRIWAYPEPYSDVMRNAFHLRYALQPYIYTEARRTYDTGVAFFRPLYYDWPESDEAYTAKNEYLFGDNMVVAPITQPADKTSQLASERVWIPPGEWIEWPTGTHLSGPVSVTRSFSISQIPVYVRAGAIVPMQPEMRYTGEKPIDPLIVNVFPMRDGQFSSYTVYEDDSKSTTYKRGVCTWTQLNAHRSGATLDVSVEPVRGHYVQVLRVRGYEVRLPGDWPPSSVTVNGNATTWHYEGNTLTTVVDVRRLPTGKSVDVRVRWDASLVARRDELNGFAGAITRLRGAYDALNGTYPLTWSPEDLVYASQTGDRLSYHPSSASAEIAHFEGAYDKAVSSAKAAAQNVANADAPETERTLRSKLLARRAVLQIQDGRR